MDGRATLSLAHRHRPQGRASRAGGRWGRGLAQVGDGQGRAGQPARQRRPQPGQGACHRAGRRLQRPAADLL